MARALKTRAVKSGSKERAKKFAKKQVVKKLSAVTQKPKPVAKKEEPTIEAAPEAPKKNISQKLLEVIERRKREREEADGEDVEIRRGRRGRRPKNVDGNGNTNQEDPYVFESEYERLEYDTGIRAKDHSDDFGGGLDRVEEFDEELNFDW